MSKHSELASLITKTAETIFNNAQYPVGELAAKAVKVAEILPYDTTVIAMSNFLAKKASSPNQLFISREELRSVYNKLYTNRTKFGTYFTEELGLEEKPNKNQMVRDSKEGIDFDKLAEYGKTNQLLLEQIEQSLSGSKEYKAYTVETGKQAERKCAEELSLFGVAPNKVNTVAGQEDMLICQAVYETPKGITGVLIPVEVKNGRPMSPSVFLGRLGFVDFNTEYLQDHIKSTAGKAFKVNANELLAQLSTARSGQIKSISKIEHAVLERLASKEAASSINGVLLQEVDKLHEDVDVKMPETDSFAEKLSSDKGMAEFLFGKALVEKARNAITLAVKTAGLDPQVTVSACNEDSVHYAVGVNRKFGFTVPVRLKNGSVELPSLVIAAGKPYEFSTEGLKLLVNSAVSDLGALTKTSSAYGVKPSELVEIIRQAMVNSDHMMAEEALVVLGESNDKIAYQNGYAIYMSGLTGGFNKEAEKTCRAIVQHRHSQYSICSHTGLPIHKVYQDESGDCHPMYRKGMKNSSEGVSFMTSRIYFE